MADSFKTGLVMSAGLLLFVANAQAQLPDNILSPALPGTTESNVWDSFSRDINPQVNALANDGDPTNDFPGFFNSTSLWPEPIESVITAGTLDTVDDAPTGDAVFDKITGGGYPAGISIYNAGTIGRFSISDETPVTDLSTVVFQVELGGAFVPGATPVLNYNGGTQSLEPLIELTFDSGRVFGNPGPGDPVVETQISAFQWDLRGIDSVTDYDIVWETTERNITLALQTDASDAFLPIADLPDTPGDYNGDGLVDSGDFQFFVNAFGSSDPGADGNQDGLVGASDFSIWRDQTTPSVPTSSAAVAAVPEPTSTTLAVCVITMAPAARRARCSNRAAHKETAR